MLTTTHARVVPVDDPAAALARRVRRHLLPPLFVLYVVAYLDRINVGFAAFDMNRELGLSSEQYGLLSGIFFWGYFLFEVPSNLMLHRTGARRWIARILLTWGLIAVLTVLPDALVPPTPAGRGDRAVPDGTAGGEHPGCTLVRLDIGPRTWVGVARLAVALDPRGASGHRLRAADLPLSAGTPGGCVLPDRCREGPDS